jgi:hypothetical protein
VAAKLIDKAVDETPFEVGDEVFVIHPPGLLEVGKKLRAPWRGPYIVDAKLCQVSYLLKDREGKVSRTHVNRLTSKKPGVRECQGPVQGIFSRFLPSARKCADRRPASSEIQDQEQRTLRINVDTRETSCRTPLYGRTSWNAKHVIGDLDVTRRSWSCSK